MQREPPSRRVVGWSRTSVPLHLCMFPESLLLPSLVSGGPQGLPQIRGLEGMLGKPYPREMGKFSIRRPEMVVVSVRVQEQAGGTWRSRTGCPSVCLLSSLSHARTEFRDVLANPSQGFHSPNNSRLA